MSLIWVDSVTTEIHPRSTWETLNLDQLMDTKNKLLNKLQITNGKPEYARPILSGVAQLEAMISAKLTGASEKGHLKIT